MTGDLPEPGRCEDCGRPMLPGVVSPYCLECAEFHSETGCDMTTWPPEFGDMLTQVITAVLAEQLPGWVPAQSGAAHELEFYGEHAT